MKYKGIKFVKAANMWQFYIKENVTKLNNKSKTHNKEEWFVTRDQALARLNKEEVTQDTIFHMVF